MKSANIAPSCLKFRLRVDRGLPVQDSRLRPYQTLVSYTLAGLAQLSRLSSISSKLLPQVLFKDRMYPLVDGANSVVPDGGWGAELLTLSTASGHGSSTKVPWVIFVREMARGLYSTEISTIKGSRSRDRFF
jgi:hypothetical protein